MQKKPSILLIDDDIELCQSIKKFLEQNGYSTHVLHDSSHIEQTIKNNSIDLILLDIILPGSKDGITLCKSIRQLTTAPIIMLTGLSTDVEEIISLEMGADNFLTKPFSSRVLLAHIKASLRRQSQASEAKENCHADSNLVNMDYLIYEFEGWRLNVTARILLSPTNKHIKLTSAEFFLLQALVKHPQCVLSRDQLLDFTNFNSDAFDRSIDILISRLRAKIDCPSRGSNIISTIRKGGYLLSCYVTKHMMDTVKWRELFLNYQTAEK